jgi:prepilin-type processing-associated H-X9-DG protein
VNRSRITNFAGTVLGADCLHTAAGSPANQRHPYSNNGGEYAALGNHGWTLDPPRLTATSDRGTGDEDSPRSGVDPRHLGQANFVFCDGHAETTTPQRLGYRILPGGAYVDLEVVEDP